MTAVDYSFARYTAAQLEAAGVVAVGRYLTGPGKAMSEVELAGLLFGGIKVWSAFEVVATDASGGAPTGEQYGAEANAAWAALHQSESNPVYFAADTDYVDPEEAVPYYQGLANARAALTNGCYGEGDLIDLLFAEHLIGLGWESESSSFPGNATASANAAIWQRPSGAPLPDTDLNVILKADFGQLPRPAPAPPTAPGGKNMLANDPTSRSGSWALGPDGGIFTADGSQFYGSMAGNRWNWQAVGTLNGITPWWDGSGWGYKVAVHTNAPGQFAYYRFPSSGALKAAGAHVGAVTDHPAAHEAATDTSLWDPAAGTVDSAAA